MPKMTEVDRSYEEIVQLIPANGWRMKEIGDVDIHSLRLVFVGMAASFRSRPRTSLRLVVTSSLRLLPSRANSVRRTM